jgi:hypothetical protein
MDDRLPEYMRQPGQDEYGRSKKAKAEAAAEEAKKNPPSQKSRSYSPNDIRMRKITPSKPPSQVTPRSVDVSIGEDATKSIRASASAPTETSLLRPSRTVSVTPSPVKACAFSSSFFGTWTVIFRSSPMPAVLSFFVFNAEIRRPSPPDNP